MSVVRWFDVRRCGFRLAAQCALPLAIMGMVGCTQVNAIKTKVSDTFGGDASSQASTTSVDGGVQDGQPLPLNVITNTYLLHGRYDEGEQRLRQYLAKYPYDRTAQGLLRQLTADPKTVLGSPSRSYVVQSGDSYGTLAAHNLGDSNLFLILARYNGSSNPSALRAGDSVRLPQAGTRVNLSPDLAVSRGNTANRGASTSAVTGSAASTAPDAAPASEPSTTRAQRLQAESNALLKKGQKDQAMTRLDEALTLDPHLRPAGNQTLREQLLVSYHERAVVFYRDQKLDQAIALWDRVLAIDPNYERAVIYRARAVELQHRLKQI